MKRTPGVSGTRVVIIGGCGHVGLPLGLSLANGGCQVKLYDTDEQRRQAVQAGRMPFLERDAELILRRVLGKTLQVTAQLSDLAQADVVIVTIGTPVDTHLNPSLRPILELAEHMTPYLRPEQCVILRSTVYPGTTHALWERFQRNGLAIQLAYCPERIVQGHAIRELRELVQIVSGCTEAAAARAEAFFQGALGVETLCVTVPEAELAKLFSNAWRYVQFAIANQFYMIATERQADYARIYHAMTHHYARAKDFPRPGFAAGPCLLKDTLQLTAFHRNHFYLGHAAMMINEGLPNFLVEHLTLTLGNLTGVRVGILGMAFKAESDDTRDSLSFKLAKILAFHGAQVVCSDEFARAPAFVTKEALLSTCRAVIVGVPHAAYRGLAVPAGVAVVDLWGALQSAPAAAAAKPQPARPRRRRSTTRRIAAMASRP